MSQERMDNQESRAVDSTLGEAPNISSVLARTNQVLDKNRVIYGANERYFDQLSGKTVGSIRKSLKSNWSIPGDASALIDGKEVGDDFILQPSQCLEFQKFAGVKGRYIATTYVN